MKLARTLRKIAAFFVRDFAIARGYRGALLLETLEALFGVATFYYLSRFVESPELSQARCPPAATTLRSRWWASHFSIISAYRSPPSIPASRKRGRIGRWKPCW